MGYLIYIAGLAICVTYGISPEKIYNFADLTSFGFVMIPCALAVVSMGYGKAFVRAFGYALGLSFDKESHTWGKIEESARAVKLACVSSLIAGGLGSVIGLVNGLHSMGEPDIGSAVSVALICLFYALILNAALAPLCFMLKKLSAHR